MNKDPNQIILHFTPFLFAITIVHAGCKKNMVMYSLMSILMTTSLILHGKWYDKYDGREFVRQLDIITAHTVVLYTLYLNLYNYQFSIFAWITYFCISYIGVIYLICIKPYEYIRPFLHATIHIAGVIGSNTVMI